MNSLQFVKSIPLALLGILAVSLPASGDGETAPRAGLTWQKQPPADKKAWTDAKSYCATALGGGMRLPTRDELKALYLSKSNSGPDDAASRQKDQYGWPGMDTGCYWSSTPTDVAGQMYCWSFDNNSAVRGNQNDPNDKKSVRCAR